jgi:AbrB family looped-hinge helix DNA binding protein
MTMPNVSTAKMSSKGQIVIPEEIRKRLGLKEGSSFIVLGEDDIVILKTISSPSLREFDKLIKRARNQARSAGLRRSDISSAIAEVRTKH